MTMMLTNQLFHYKSSAEEVLFVVVLQVTEIAGMKFLNSCDDVNKAHKVVKWTHDLY